MKKFIYAIILSAVTGVFVSAQTSGDYKKTEFFVGYSNGQNDVTGNNPGTIRETFNGFEVAGVYNFSRYVGVKGDVSGTYKNFKFTVGVPVQASYDSDVSIYNFLGGLQLKDKVSTRRLKPFVHALIGAGYKRTVTNFQCDPTGPSACGPSGRFSSSETGLAGAFGGGLDVKINDRFDFRAIQVDYNPIKLDAGTDHNVRFGIGIVIK